MKTIERNLFKKYLKSKGLHLVKTEGGHEKWDMKTAPHLDRPIIFRTTGKDIPLLHIQTNLKTLDVTTKDFLEAISKL